MKTEKILIPLFIISILCSAFIDAPGIIITTISLSVLLALVYFPAGFYFLSGITLKQQNFVLSIIGGLFMCFAVLGILFKFMYWPGRSVALFSSSVVLVILVLISIIVSKKAIEEKKEYYKNFTTRCIIWASLSCFTYFVPNAFIIEARYKDEPKVMNIRLNQDKDPENYMKYELELRDHYYHLDSLGINK